MGQKRCITLVLILLSISTQAQIKGSLWDVDGINATPTFSKKYRDSVFEIIYSGLNYKGVPKKTFAYYATPGSLNGHPESDQNLPVVILVHGGGGTAYIEWVKHWARLGYAALAMDGRGNRPDGQHIQDGFQENAKGTPIYTITKSINDQWMFQAVADILLAHNLVRSFKEVDINRTALVGISWGAVLTLITSGLDHRFKAAVPIYGCGFFPTSIALGQGLNELSPQDRATWLQQYDPSHYISKAPMPLLFLNGTNDGAFYLDSYIKTYQLAHKKQLCIKIGLQHGHYGKGVGYEIREPYFFIDQYLKGNAGLTTFVHEKQLRDGSIKASLKYKVPIEKAWLHYTKDTASNLFERSWLKKEIVIHKNKIKSGVPPTGAVMWYLHVADKRGLESSGKVYTSE